ncbi:uncharacterized protein [Heterodontus francisci]|uniref:uncharacterized protein n=1 Tax=Heterodontus francisci TaxID=7792 RepID=UPI00355B9170
METLSLLGSASTLASSVVELEISTEAEVAELGSPEVSRPRLPSRDEGSAERIAQSEEEKQENGDQYEEAEFSGIGNIDLEMEQIFADMELLQKAASGDLDASVEDSSPQRRMTDEDDTLLDAFEDTDVEASGLSLVDISSVNETEESRPCNGESSEDDDLHKESPSLTNLENVLDGTNQAQASEDIVSYTNGRSMSRDIACSSQRLLSSSEDNHSDSNDSKLYPSSREDNSQVNGYPVAMESENQVEEEFTAIEKVLSTSPTDRSEKPNIGKRDLLRMENDRLLIEKIKNYYETAEMSTDQFYLQRRESISFIPTGVVKDSILRFNYKMTHESIQEVHSDKVSSSSSRPCSSTNASSSTLSSDSQLGNAEPCPSAIQDQEEPKLSDEGPGSSLYNSYSNSAESESQTEFKTCTEIIKVWREMEKAAHFCHKYESWNGYTKAAKKNKALLNHQQMSFSEPLLILEDSDLSSLTDFSKESPDIEQNPTEKTQGSKPGRGHEYCPSEDMDCRHTSCCVSREIAEISLCEDIDNCLFQNSEKIMNKVQVLAKMYSQRISRKKAPMPRRIWELGPETRAEPKQRKRRPIIKLSRAQEEHQDIKTYDEVKVLETPAPYGHLVIQEPIPILYAQENTIQVSISKAKAEISSLQLHDPREGSPPQQVADPTLQSITSLDPSQMVPTSPLPIATSPQAPSFTSSDSMLQTSLISSLSTECPSLIRISSRPSSLTSELPSSLSQSLLLPVFSSNKQAPLSTASSRAQSPTSECLGRSRHNSLPSSSKRSSSQTNSRPRSPTSECSSPLSPDWNLSSKKHISSPSQLSYKDQSPVSDSSSSALEEPFSSSTKPKSHQIPPPQTVTNTQPPAPLHNISAELISDHRRDGPGVKYPPSTTDEALEQCFVATTQGAESLVSPSERPSVDQRQPSAASSAAHETPPPKYGSSLMCTSSELCCSLPTWVSLRGRSPSPSAIKQLEQSMKPPKGSAALARATHTVQPSPSVGPDAKMSSPLQTRNGPTFCATSSREQEWPSSDANLRTNSLPPKCTSSMLDSGCPSKTSKECSPFLPGSNLEAPLHSLSTSLRLRSPSPFRRQHWMQAPDSAGLKPYEELPTFSNQRPDSLQLCTATTSYPSPTVPSPLSSATVLQVQSPSLLCTKGHAPSPALPQLQYQRGRVNSFPSLNGPETLSSNKAVQASSSDTGLGFRSLLSSPIHSCVPPAHPMEDSYTSLVFQRDSQGQDASSTSSNSETHSPVQAITLFQVPPQCEKSLRLRSPSPLCRGLWPESSSSNYSATPTEASPVKNLRDQCPSQNSERGDTLTTLQTSTKPCSSAVDPERSLPSQSCTSPVHQPPAVTHFHKEVISSVKVERNLEIQSLAATSVIPSVTSLSSATPASGIYSLMCSQSLEAFSPLSCSSPRVQTPVPTCTVRRIRSPSPERSTTTGLSPSSSHMSSRVGSPVSLYISIQSQLPAPSMCPSPSRQSPRIMSPPMSPPTSSPSKWLNGSVQVNQQAAGNTNPCVSIRERSCSPSFGDSRRSSKDCVRELINGRLYNNEHFSSPSCTSPVAEVPYSAGRKTSLSSEELETLTWPDVHELRSRYIMVNDEDSGPQSCQKTDQEEAVMVTSSSDSADGRPESTEKVPDAEDGGGTAHLSAAEPGSGLDERFSNLTSCRSVTEASPSREKGDVKASYSTTVNLQIGGSGRTATFSKAQVSLTQMFLPVTGQSLRKVTGGNGASQTT